VTALALALGVVSASHAAKTPWFNHVDLHAQHVRHAQVGSWDYSYDWSGYVADIPDVTRIDGSWIVAKAAFTNSSTYSSQWIGIGGYHDNSLIQTGTSSDYGFNDEYVWGPHYYTWVEFLPDAEVYEFPVNPGDMMRAGIVLDNPETNLWDISIEDQTTGQAYHESVTYDSTRQAAEWIEERPMVAQLAKYGIAKMGGDYTGVPFADQASNGSGLLPLGQLANVRPIGMVSDSGKYLISGPGTISTDGTSFEMFRLFGHRFTLPK
jgi:hypothetical protein